MEESCVKQNIKVPTTELEAYSMKSSCAPKQRGTSLKDGILKFMQETTIKPFTRADCTSFATWQMIIANSRQIVKHADLTF